MPDLPLAQDASVSLRETVLAAIVEARRLGSSHVEAEHLLLSLAGDRHSPCGAFLHQHNLDHQTLLAMLEQERAHTLRSIGVEPPDPAALNSTRIKRPGWGQSARQSLATAHRSSGGGRRGRGRHRLTNFDLLDAILRLRYGTVPRCLTLGGVDVAALRTDVAEHATRAA